MLLNTGCQLTYITKSAIGQFKILNHRVPMAEALENPKLNEAQRSQMRLALEAKEFAVHVLHLKPTDNYSTWVDLDRPYVSWAVSAAEKQELKAYRWSFPFVGEVPYKGFFTEQEALEEVEELKLKNLDTYMRGITAYSTLGWFSDPLLSSMVGYSPHGLVNVILHETTHTTLYIRSHADFNERLATFVGNKGTELFYQSKGDLLTLEKIRQENEDEMAFSKWITAELNSLDEWYKGHPNSTEPMRQARFEEIRNSFHLKLVPQLKTKMYGGFAKAPINNARLLLYRTYNQNLEVFEKVWQQNNGDFDKFFAQCKSLENSKDPERDILGLKQ